MTDPAVLTAVSGCPVSAEAEPTAVAEPPAAAERTAGEPMPAPTAEAVLSAETEEPAVSEPPTVTADTDADADEALAQRLAADFEALCREVPEVSSFAAVPEAAVREAVEQGISLLDAYLRHAHREQRRVAAAQAAERAAATAAVGSQSDAAGEPVSPVVAAMLRGVWGD